MKTRIRHGGVERMFKATRQQDETSISDKNVEPCGARDAYHGYVAVFSLLALPLS